MTAITRLSLLALVFLGGCLTGSAGYVDEHAVGNSIVRGRFISVEGLNTADWKDLSDGFVFVVDEPGCTVVFKQGERQPASFQLQPGDAVVHGSDTDYILSSLHASGPASAGAAKASGGGGDAPATHPVSGQ